MGKGRGEWERGCDLESPGRDFFLACQMMHTGGLRRMSG
jgi:hypothetical protein